MKKIILSLSCILLLLRSSAQLTWNPPVRADQSLNHGDVGYNTSSAIVNGNPAMVYYDQGEFRIMFVRALDATGTTWGPAVIIDSVDVFNEKLSLQVVNGNPAVAYYGGTNGNLCYKRASDMNGSTWGTKVTVDASGMTGFYASMKIVNGNPAIAYYDWLNTTLKYVRASDASGTTWNTPLTLDGATVAVGSHCSLSIIAGNPAISYSDDDNFNL
ncbi:MAG TPA: hypothetical protein VD905_03475, partial [Flavobacteriales bacterium]|nr:hypothetical protein [Flavobacteriales bacterium]